MANKKTILFFLLNVFVFYFIFSQDYEPLNFPNNKSVQLLPQGINTPYYEYTPFILPEDTRLFFQSDRPGSMGGYGDFDIWYIHLSTENIPEPINLGTPLNNKNYQGTPSLRKNQNNELEIYFTQTEEKNDAPGTRTDLYYSVFHNNQWIKPVPLYVINTPFHERMPSISRDGSQIYFSSDRPGGFGKDDIWISSYNKDSKKWEKPINAGRQINTVYSEISPSSHPDSVTLYFASNRKDSLGGYDIYVTQKLPNQSWKNPTNLGAPYNTQYDEEYPTVTMDGKTMYFTSNRPNGYGKFDIYSGEVPEFAKPKVIIFLKGRILEKLDNDEIHKGIEANLHVYSREDNRNIASNLPGGEFELPLQNDRIYQITVSSPGYETSTFMVDLRDEHVTRAIHKNYFLKRITEGQKLEASAQFTLKIAFFDKEKETLKPILMAKINQNGESKAEKFWYNSMEGYYFRGYTHDEISSLIKNGTLELSAELDSFQSFHEILSFSNIIEEKDNQLPKEVTLKIILSAKNDNIRNLIKNLHPIEKIYFSYNRHNLISKTEKIKLDRAIQMIKEKNPNQIIIHGHADKTGPLEYNDALSKKRALYIKSLFIKAGLDENKIIAAWFGEEKSIYDANQKYNAAKNRRVEIFLIENKNKKGP